MIKRVTLLTRRSDVPLEEFVQRWTTVHGRMARSLPDLVRYVQCIVEPSHGVIGDTPEVDGISEAWFEDREAMARSDASEPAKALLADRAEFVGRVQTYVVTETAVIG